MGISAGPNGVSNGLVMDFDIMNPRSYSGSGITIYNIANSGIAGTIVTGVTYDTGYRKNLNFNGSSGYIFSNDTSMDFTNKDFTIQTVIKLNGLSNGFFGAYGSVICAGNTLTNNSSIFHFLGTATSHYGLGLWHQPSSTTVGANYNFQTNRIYNIAVTKNSNQIEFFVNGASIGTTTSSNNFNFTANGFAIGRWYYPGYEQYLKGSIYELKSYSRALTTSEILQNYNASKGRFTTSENIVTNGLVLNIDSGNYLSYPGIGNTIYDLSGSGINGTFVNSPSFIPANGGQINMPGSSKYIDFGQNFNFTSENFSISYWIYLDSFETINNPGQGPIPFYKGDFNIKGYYSQVNQNGSYSLVTNAPTNQISETSAGTLTTASWYHIANVRNGSSIRIYLNGTDRTNTAVSHSNPASSSDSFKINYYKGDYLISGQMRISQFLIYNRALSATEVMQNFNAMRERYNI